MPAVSDYPYTIEYKYTIENKGIVGFKTWMPQKWFNISVEEAELSFKTSVEFDIKFKELNHDFMPAVLLSPNEIVYEGTNGDFHHGKVMANGLATLFQVGMNCLRKQ